RMKFYLKSVEQTTRGPQLVVSRVNKDIINKIFEMEIPEVASGVITIKSVAREAGNRSKVAIFSDDDNIDPIGSCVGQRGARIQTIINELNGEKVDIILWNEDSIKFITNAMSPAKVISVKFKDAKDESVEKSAVVTVKEDQLSLAIGKAGQNVRLASKLTGWKLDIISDAVKISDKKEKIVEELTDDKDNGDNEKAEGGEKIDDKEKTAKKKTIKQKDQESEEVDGDKKENKDKKKQEETEKPVE
ncbi:MAG TPA: transcription termination/antitermination protein NusA, partial [Patescibacteria group bacterium]|nr:transcription termination/antitermination protein NusA [Patescibacteria group bacterium]